MLLAYALLCIDFKIDLLIFTKFSNQDIFMNESNFKIFSLLIALRNPLELI